MKIFDSLELRNVKLAISCLSALMFVASYLVSFPPSFQMFLKNFKGEYLLDLLIFIFTFLLIHKILIIIMARMLQGRRDLG